MFCMAKSAKKNLFFARQFKTTFKQKCSNLRPLLFITFPQGFRISKIYGHPTLGKGAKKTFKRYLKSEQTNTRTDTRTFPLIESIGPGGRCFEKVFVPLWVGPVDNRPFTDWLHHFVPKNYTLILTQDMWHVTHDMWHVTHGGGCAFSQNFSFLALTVWERQHF